MSYQTQAAIGPYPVNCLLWLCHGYTGIAAIDDVSGAIVDLSTSMFILLFAIAPAAFAPAVEGCMLSLRLLSLRLSMAYSLDVVNRGLLPLPLAFAILLACYSPAMTVHCTGLDSLSTIISLADSGTLAVNVMRSLA
jgi:hypothetical protein